MGVVSAILKFAGADWFCTEWAESNAAGALGLLVYIALIVYMALHTLRAKKEN